MRSLFRSFERQDLDYLLISGQAAILYGAATFSEDIDLWIRPTPANAARLLRALADRGATVYKLTPPLSGRNLLAGHGFHFLVPAPGGPVYLDITGRPPQVGPFGVARRRARIMSTAWGRIPVVSIVDLIALKLTKRLADYDVISNLVRVRLQEAEHPNRALLRWAMAHSFRAEDRLEFAGHLGMTQSEEDARQAILAEIARYQAQDAAYWRRIVDDLRLLRAGGRLLREGTPVFELLSRGSRTSAGRE
jgi:hypothetical protein